MWELRSRGVIRPFRGRGGYSGEVVWMFSKVGWYCGFCGGVSV